MSELATISPAARLRNRHAAWYVAVAEKSRPAYWTLEQAHVTATLELEHDNLRSALRWLRESQQISDALRLGTAIWEFWWIRGYFGEGRAQLDHLLALPDEASHREGFATVRNGAGMLALLAGDLPAARSHLELAVAYWREWGDRRKLANPLILLGMVARDQEDLVQATLWHEEALAMNRDLGQLLGIALALHQLGNTLLERGELARSRDLLEESVEAYRQARANEGMIAHVLQNRGVVAEEMGDDQLALRLGRQVLTTAAREDNHRLGAHTIENMASLAAKTGRPHRALQLLGAAARLREEAGTPMLPLVQRRIARTLNRALAQLPPDEADAELARGRHMGWHEAYTFALTDPDGSSYQDSERASAT